MSTPQGAVVIVIVEFAHVDRWKVNVITGENPMSPAALVPRTCSLCVPLVSAHRPRSQVIGFLLRGLTRTDAPTFVPSISRSSVTRLVSVMLTLIASGAATVCPFTIPATVILGAVAEVDGVGVVAGDDGAAGVVFVRASGVLISVTPFKVARSRMEYGPAGRFVTMYLSVLYAGSQ